MAATRRILILSASFGGGYSAAAAVLARHFATHHPSTVEARVVDLFDEYLPGLSVRARFAYQQSVRLFPHLSGTLDDVVEREPDSLIVQELEGGGRDTIAAMLAGEMPDAILCTHPAIAGIVRAVRSDDSALICCVVTDYSVEGQWIDPSADMYFVSCGDVREELVLAGVPWDRIAVTGVPVDVGDDTLVDRMQGRSELGLQDRFTAMLSFAGGGVSDAREVVRQLASSGIQVLAIAPEGQRLTRHLRELEGAIRSFRLFESAVGTHTIANVVDVCVVRTGGGTGIPEALAAGLPLVVLGPVPDQESPSVDLVVNFGAALLARDEGDVVRKVRFLSNHQHRLEQMATDARLLGRPNATRTICERLLAALR